MKETFALAELEAYLDEALPPPRMARIEQALRDSAALAERLTELISRRDAGVHSLGAIWRRRRLSCPTREQLGSYLLGVLSSEAADYYAFHLDVVGCRYCQANLDDLRRAQSEQETAASARRQRYFQSSAGRLHKA